MSEDQFSRCPITSLLSDTDNIQQGDTADSRYLLSSSSKHILESCSLISSIDVGTLSSNILASHMELDLLQKRHSNTTTEDQSQFQEIQKDLLKSQLLLSEKAILVEALERFSTSTESPNNPDPFRFNIITQKMIREDGSIISRKKRLARQKVAILEDWYYSHPEKPNLNESMLLSLVKKTGLTKGQIRNWISNKRRKEREDKIGDSISCLVSGLVKNDCP